MIIWLDAHLPASLGNWINQNFGIETWPLKDLGLLSAEDMEIFLAAREANTILMTKDSDFTHLQIQHGVPPQIILLTCGNLSKNALKSLLAEKLPETMVLLKKGETLVEIHKSDK